MFPLEPLSLDTTRVARSSKEADDRLLALGGTADEVQDQLVGAGRGADKAGDDLAGLSAEGSATDKVFTSLTGSAKQLFGALAGSVSIGAMVQVLREASREWGIFEAGLRGVGKTSNITGDALREVGRRLEDLTRPGRGGLAVSADLLLENAEAAGQLGVQGASNIVKYAETIARLGLASNLAGQEGATALARLQNITGESSDTVDVLASVIVSLGNNFAATEAQIAHHAGEVARATAVYEVSSAEAAAMGTVLAAFGVRAELAGSATGRSMRTIEDAVKSGGDAMKAFERLTGNSAEEIKAAWQRGPIEAFQLFLGGVKDVLDANGNVAAALETVGLRGEEVLKVIPVLAKENDELARALRLQATEQENATALINESNAAMDTQEGRLTLLKGEWSALERELGENAAPTLQIAVDLLVKLTEGIGDAQTVGEVLATQAQQSGVGVIVAYLFGTTRAANIVRDVSQLLLELRKFREVVEDTGEVAADSEGDLSKWGDRITRVLGGLREVREEQEAVPRTAEDVERAQDRVSEAIERQKNKLRELRDAYKESIAAIKDDLESYRRQAELIEEAPLPSPPGADIGGAVDESVFLPSAEALEQMLEDVSSEKWVEWSGTLLTAADGFAAMNNEAGDLLATLTDMGSAIAGMVAQGAELSHVLGAAASMLASTGLLGSSGSSILGGAGAGAQLGLQLGGPTGAAIGAGIGAAVGAITDMLDETAQGFANAATHAEGVKTDVQNGDLGGKVGDAVGLIQDEFNSVLDSLGGVVTSFVDFGVLFREDSKGWRVAIQDVWHDFGDDLQGLVDFTITELLARSDIIGIDPEVKAVLGQAAGKSLDEVGAEIDAALRVAAGKMGEDVFGYREQVRAIFADFQTVFEAGGDATAGTLGRLRQMWDAATGQQKSAEEIFEGRKRIILAEIDLEIARLEAEQRALQAEADQAQVAITIDEQRLLAHHEILRGEAHVVQATADFAGQLVAIANIISELELLRGEIAITPFRPPSIPGVGRPSGGLGPRVDVEAIEREIALAEARGAGNEALVEALRLEEQMAGLRERGWTQEQIDRLLAAQAAEEALAEEAAELARQEEEAARQAAELRQQIDDLFGQLEAFGDGRSGASGQIQDAIDQMQAMWDALNELRPEDLSPEELAAASDLIQNAIQLTADEISRIGTELVTGTLAGALRTAIDRETDPRERLRLQEELFELERALGMIKRQAAIAELAQVEALMRLQGLWTAELEEQSNRAIELLLKPWPDFVAQVEGAGRTFAATVGAAASAGTPQERLFALIDKVAALGVETGQVSPFDALREEVSDFMGLFPEFSDILSGLMKDIDELEFAARLKEWADTIGQVQGRLRPGGDLMIGQSNRQRLATIQDQIEEAIRTGDFQTAAQLASTGLDVAGGTSSRIFGEFASFVEGLSLDQFQAETSAETAEIAETQRAGMLNAFEQAAAQRQQQHGETENNRLMQTQEMSTRLDLLAGTVRAQTSMLERMASQHEEIYHA